MKKLCAVFMVLITLLFSVVGVVQAENNETITIAVMDKGKVVMQGTPREVFSKVDKLKELRLDVPQVTRLAQELKKRGLKLPDGILTTEELSKALKNLTGLR